MAHNNTEVEIKIPLSKEAFESAKEKIKKEAKFIKRSSQIDEYFNAPHRDFLAPASPFEWLSLRKRGDKIILNYKHWLPENAEIHTHCDEYETNIADADNLKKIFSALNLKTLITVEKDREIYEYEGEFEIGLDIVKDLGYFIEIESIKDFGSVDETRKKLFELAEMLGIDASKPDERGYPYDLMKKKGLLKAS